MTEEEGGGLERITAPSSFSAQISEILALTLENEVGKRDGRGREGRERKQGGYLKQYSVMN